MSRCCSCPAQLLPWAQRRRLFGECWWQASSKRYKLGKVLRQENLGSLRGCIHSRTQGKAQGSGHTREQYSCVLSLLSISHEVLSVHRNLIKMWLSPALYCLLALTWSQLAFLPPLSPSRALQSLELTFRTSLSKLHPLPTALGFV